MKLRIGKKVLAFDFDKNAWVKAKIVHMDPHEGVVTIKYNDGLTLSCDVTELDDKECFREV